MSKYLSPSVPLSGGTAGAVGHQAWGAEAVALGRPPVCLPPCLFTASAGLTGSLCLVCWSLRAEAGLPTAPAGVEARCDRPLFLSPLLCSWKYWSPH